MSQVNQTRKLITTFGMKWSWLRTIEGRMTVAHIVGMTRCKNIGTPADNISIDDLIFILRNKQGYRCAYCPYRIIFDFHLDHIIPISRGGGHTIDNIQFACEFCNVSKSDGDRPTRIPYFDSGMEDDYRTRSPLAKHW